MSKRKREWETDDKQAEPPDEVMCPITLMPMISPVMAADGRSYEETEIKKWLEKSDKSPMTNAPLSSTRIYPNFALRTRICEWKKKQKAKAEIQANMDIIHAFDSTLATIVWEERGRRTPWSSSQESMVTRLAMDSAIRLPRCPGLGKTLCSLLPRAKFGVLRAHAESYDNSGPDLLLLRNDPCTRPIQKCLVPLPRHMFPNTVAKPKQRIELDVGLGNAEIEVKFSENVTNTLRVTTIQMLLLTQGTESPLLQTVSGPVMAAHRSALVREKVILSGTGIIILNSDVPQRDAVIDIFSKTESPSSMGGVRSFLRDERVRQAVWRIVKTRRTVSVAHCYSEVRRILSRDNVTDRDIDTAIQYWEDQGYTERVLGYVYCIN